MARKQINFDKTEVVVGFPAGKRFLVLNLSYQDIQRLQFDTIRELSFFRKIPSEKLTIVTGKRPQPIVYTKKKQKAFWDEYKARFTKFAKDNHITFVDNT